LLVAFNPAPKEQTWISKPFKITTRHAACSGQKPKMPYGFFSQRWANWLKLTWCTTKSNLTDEEVEMLKTFADEGFHADEIVSRVEGWVRNNDRVKKEDIGKEVADCEMMLAVFMYSLTHTSPDDALLQKMKEKLGDKADFLRTSIDTPKNIG
jgi:hypothetical protein